MIKFIRWLATNKRYFLINGFDGSPYLLRIRLWGNLIGDDKRNIENGIKVKKPITSGYLHKFYRPDDDREVHDHPWLFSFSIILSGGYEEEKLRNGKLTKRILKPFSINIFLPSDHHRVTKLNGDEVWSFFLAVLKRKDWGFLDLETGIKTPHEEFFKKKSLT